MLLFALWIQTQTQTLEWNEWRRFTESVAENEGGMNREVAGGGRGQEGGEEWQDRLGKVNEWQRTAQGRLGVTGGSGLGSR